MPKRSRYFWLDDEMKGGNWYLGDPVDKAGHEVEDIWEFIKGRPIRPAGCMTFPIREAGKRKDYSTAGVGRAPIVHFRVATIFAEMASNDVQLIPVDIEGCPDEYQVLVATKLIKCIDEKTSREILIWKPEDGRPEKVGKYRSVAGMRIDPTKVGDAKVFRTWGWTGALIVSEDIKAALERAKVTGAKFEEV